MHAADVIDTKIFQVLTSTCPVAQLIANTIADPGSLIPAGSHTFMEIDHEIFSGVILLLSPIQEGLTSVTRESMCTKYWLTAWSSLPRKKCGKVNLLSQHDHSC